MAALARVREQEEEACLLERLRAEDPRCPDGSPGLRVRRVEAHLRSVRRRSIPLQLVDERVDLLSDDLPERRQPGRLAEPALEIRRPERLHEGQSTR